MFSGVMSAFAVAKVGVSPAVALAAALASPSLTGLVMTPGLSAMHAATAALALG